MPRLKPTVTININFHPIGEKCKFELCWNDVIKKYRIRYNRVNSMKVEYLTISEFCVKLRKFLKIKTSVK